MDNIISLELLKMENERINRRNDENQQGVHFGYYSISEISYCLRRHFWSLKQRKPAGLDGLRRMELGNIIQDWSDKLLIRHYKDQIVRIERTITIPIQTPNVKEEWIFLTGRIDHLLSFKTPNNRRYFCPIEAKYLVDQLVSNLKEPKTGHLYQINSYLLGMSGESGFLYYIDHHLRSKTFNIDFSLDIWNETKDRLFTLHSYVKEDELPPAEAMYADDYLKGSCWFCPYYKNCKIEEEK